MIWTDDKHAARARRASPITTFSVTAFVVTAFGVTAFGVTAFGVTAFVVTAFGVTLSLSKGERHSALFAI